MATNFKPCSIDGCNGNSSREATGRAGYCQNHYRRKKLYGAPTTEPRKAALNWLMSNAAYDGDDCLIFPFHRNNRGYGCVTYNGKLWVASRLMCTIEHGEPPEQNYHAAHNCGNGKRGCVNPKHLSWKSASENENDKYEHGTRFRGQQAAQAKLTLQDVLNIRSSKERECDIVRRYPFVTRGTIVDVIKRKTWKHV